MRYLHILAALFVFGAIQGSALADAGRGTRGGETAFGVPGDPKKPTRVVNIAMRETGDGKMLFTPNRITVKRGEQIRFMLRNNGQLDHEFVLGTLQENLKHAEQMKKNPDMEHDEPYAKRLTPKQTGEILWRFTKGGEFDFSCLIPGHPASGMSGVIVVSQ